MIKRVKILEAIKECNLKNITKGKVVERTLAKEVGIKIETISRWNTGANVPKALECLLSLSLDLEVPIKDLWYTEIIDGEETLIAIKIDEALDVWNDKNMGVKSIEYLCKNLDFTNFKIHCWKKRKDKPRGISPSVIILFKICKALNCDPNEILETYGR